MKNLLAAASIAFVTLGSPSSRAQSPPQEFVDARSAIPSTRTAHAFPGGLMEVGRGWISATEEPAQDKCVINGETPQDQTQQSSAYHEATSRYEYNRLLQISASASGSYYGASGSASYNLTNSLTLDDQTIHVVGVGYVVTKTVTATAPAPAPAAATASLASNIPLPSVVTEDALPILSSAPQLVHFKSHYATLLSSGTQPDQQAFARNCGDSFIAAVIYGGEYVADFLLHTKSRAESESVSGTLSGKYSGVGVRAAVDVTANQTIIKWNTDHQLTILRAESGGTLVPEPVKYDEFIDDLKQFPLRVGQAAQNNASRPVYVILKRYDNVIGWPPNKDFPKLWENGVRLARKQAALEETQGLIQFALDNRSEQIFDDHLSEDMLRLEQSRVATEINLTKKARAQCSAHPEGCPDVVGRDDYESRALLPVRKDEVSLYPKVQAQRALVAKTKAEMSQYFNERVGRLESCAEVRGDRGLGTCQVWLEELRSERRALALVEAAYLREYVDKRIDKWLWLTNNERCDGDQWEWGCVSPSEIEGYRKKLEQEYSNQ